MRLRGNYWSALYVVLLLLGAVEAPSQQLAGPVEKVHVFTSAEEDISVALRFGGIAVFYKDSDEAMESLRIQLRIPEEIASYAHNFTFFVYTAIPGGMQEKDFYEARSTFLFSTQLPSKLTHTVIIPFEPIAMYNSIERKVTKETFIGVNSGIACVIQPNIKGFPIHVYNLDILLHVTPRHSRSATLFIEAPPDTALISSDLEGILTLAVDGLPRVVTTQNIVLSEGSKVISLSGALIRSVVFTHSFVKGKEFLLPLTTEQPKNAIFLFPKHLHEKYTITMDGEDIGEQHAVLLIADTNEEHVLEFTQKRREKKNDTRQEEGGETLRRLSIVPQPGVSYTINKENTIVPVR